jgi:putative addiction module component (TIGR02574 family)
MTPTAEHLLNAALGLPEDERLELVDALIISFQTSNGPPFDDTWREIIARRSAELDSGAVKAASWDEVKRRARESIGG